MSISGSGKIDAIHSATRMAEKAFEDLLGKPKSEKGKKMVHGMAHALSLKLMENALKEIKDERTNKW